MAKLQTTIGLEIHVQLKTSSKMFCGCTNEADPETPNVYICPICMGHPGTLPVPNKQAILLTLRIGKALGSRFPKISKFDRKNYFYPDLPKGYQISQYDQPFCQGGGVEILRDNKNELIRFNRVHLEEDAAKLTHTAKGSLVDYNRAGTPLAEIVTEPDLRSAPEAADFLRELRTILRYLDASDADMEKGNFRVDANISIQEPARKATTAVVEIKNLNSFRAVEQALLYEEARLSEIVKEGKEKEVVKETRGWSDKRGETSSQRNKEEASDYKYFPEPDIPPVEMKELLKNEALNLPEMPSEKRQRFEEQFSLDLEAARIITEDSKLADYYEQTTSELNAWLEAEDMESVEKQKVNKLVSNWILAELIKHMNAKGEDISQIKISPENYAEFIKMVFLGTVNSSAAQMILTEMYETGADPTEIMKNKNLEQVSDADALQKAVDDVVVGNPGPVEDYKNGKEKALQFLVGQVMKETKGKANPQMLQEIFERRLKD
ncbi:Asp-tRNA(Asn)/Glu-tRNA(Gln) amidotransferase subunit GatB [Patescibacteria group bacterium]